MHIHTPIDAALAAIPVVEHVAPIGGSETVWWEYGPTDAAHTIVLVHGFRGTHHGLLSVVAQLPDIRFLAPDLPGFGRSGPMPTGHGLDDYAGWLREFLGYVDPTCEAVVLGHSFGSLVVARDVRALAPRRIVLVNPIAAPALEGPDRVGTWLAVLYYRLGALLPRRLGTALVTNRLITRIMSEIMAVTRRPALRAWIHREHDLHFSEFADRDTLAEAFRASVSDAVLAHAAEFLTGTTLVAGERDVIAPLAAQRSLHRAMPGSTLHVIGGVGHLIHYETPAAVARILRGVLDGPSDSSEAP